MYAQARNPNVNIPVTPGYCLVYVQQAFGIGAKYPTAMAAWNEGSAHNHADQDFPAGVAVPIFFAVAGNEDGHVAIRMPDGSIYSSSSPTANVPIHHASLAAMQQYWGNGSMLTVLGWSEDVEDVAVVTPAVAHVVAPTPAGTAGMTVWNGVVTSESPFNVRSAPSLSSPIDHVDPAGTASQVIGYIKGDEVAGSNVWLVAARVLANGSHATFWCGNTNWPGPREV